MWAAIIGAIIAAMGAYQNYNAQKKAAKAVAAENLRALQARNARERENVEATKKRAHDYDYENQQAEQEQIQRDLEQDYYKPAEEAQAINQAATTTQGDVSGDYTSAKAAAGDWLLGKSRDFANTLSRINAAKDWRTQEGYKVGDLAADIGLQRNFQQGDDAVSQMRMQAAANSQAGRALMGQLMQIGGTSAMTYGLGNLGGGNTGSPYAGMIGSTQMAGSQSALPANLSGIGSSSIKSAIGKGLAGLKL